jgi:hypothetical protein
MILTHNRMERRVFIEVALINYTVIVRVINCCSKVRNGGSSFYARFPQPLRVFRKLPKKDAIFLQITQRLQP